MTHDPHIEQAKRILALKAFLGLGLAIMEEEDNNHMSALTGHVPSSKKAASPLEASRLYQLARSRNPEDRAALGDAITDLFSTTSLSLREQEIVSDILIAMLRQAEKDLRCAIADRMAILENAPLRVILHLSTDEIEVARPILEQSPVLEEMDLILIIEMHKSPYWQSIARRKDLKSTVVQALVETRDPETASVLVKNNHAIIPLEAYQILADMALTFESLSGPLLNREDIPKDLIAKLYAHVGQKIAAETAQSPQILQDVATDVTNEFVSAAQGEYAPSRLMIDAARILSARGQLSIETMIQSLKNGQMASAIAQMIVFLDIDFKQVRSMLIEPTGETLAAFCRLQKVDKKVFLKMYLLTQKYRSGERLVDPMLLSRALTIFDQMTMESCMARMKRLRTLH